MKGYRKFMLVTVLIVLLTGISTLIAPLLIQYWSLDGVGLTAARVQILCGVLLCSALLHLGCIFLRERFARDFNIGNCQKMLDDFFRMDYDKIGEMGPLKITARIRQAVNDFYSYYVNGKINILASSFVVLCILVMTALYNPLFSVILGVLVVINLGGYKALNRELLRRSETLQENSSSGWQEINSVTSHTDYLKQLSDYRQIHRQLRPSLDKIYSSMRDINIFAQTVSHLIMAFNGFVQTGIVLLVSFRFFQDQESVFSLIFYTVVLPLFFSNLSQLVGANLDKRNLVVSQRFVAEVGQSREADGTVEIGGVDRLELHLREGGHPHLKVKALDEVFHRGEIVRVKGPSGCGKSTLMKFLPKFRSTNQIFLDGRPLSQLSNRSLRQQVEYISQNIPIVKGTLRDNLFLGRPYSSQVEAALKENPILASIFATKTMDSMIDEDGANLSGGEKQKIAVARALFSPAKVLILDEVTSNIDDETARLVYRSLLASHEDKIIFVLSHDAMADEFCNRWVELG